MWCHKHVCCTTGHIARCSPHYKGTLLVRALLCLFSMGYFDPLISVNTYDNRWALEAGLAEDFFQPEFGRHRRTCSLEQTFRKYPQTNRVELTGNQLIWVKTLVQTFPWRGLTRSMTWHHKQNCTDSGIHSPMLLWSHYSSGRRDVSCHKGCPWVELILLD